MSSTAAGKEVTRRTRTRAGLEDVFFGKRLRLFRELRGLSHAELAEKVGVCRQQIQKYESAKDRMSLTMAVKLANALDISLSALTTEEGKNETITLMASKGDLPPLVMELIDVSNEASQTVVRSMITLLRNHTAHSDARLGL